VANLSKTLNINFYHNWSSVVKVMTKWCVFMPHSVVVAAVVVAAAAAEVVAA